MSMGIMESVQMKVNYRYQINYKYLVTMLYEIILATIKKNIYNNLIQI